MQMNRIEVAGYTASDPEMRYLPSGTKVVNLRLGESHRYTGTDKQATTQTNWHNLTFYNALAEQAMAYRTGINLFIEGTVQQRKFKPRDGSERTVHEIVVQSCHVIGNATQTPANAAANESNDATEEEELSDEVDATWPSVF
jgi:single-strand DNA-binding protein